MNSKNHRTMTAKKLGNLLIKLGDRPIYICKDENGDIFGTVQRKYSVCFHDDVVLLYPWLSVEYPSRYAELYTFAGDTEVTIT